MCRRKQLNQNCKIRFRRGYGTTDFETAVTAVRIMFFYTLGGGCGINIIPLQDAETRESNYALSVLEEFSFGRRQYRAILWTKDGHKRCCFRKVDDSTRLKSNLYKEGSAELQL
jgi:hypothetical protein